MPATPNTSLARTPVAIRGLKYLLGALMFVSVFVTLAAAANLGTLSPTLIGYLFLGLTHSTLFAGYLFYTNAKKPKINYLSSDPKRYHASRVILGLAMTVCSSSLGFTLLAAGAVSDSVFSMILLSTILWSAYTAHITYGAFIKACNKTTQPTADKPAQRTALNLVLGLILLCLGFAKLNTVVAWVGQLPSLFAAQVILATLTGLLAAAYIAGKSLHRLFLTPDSVGMATPLLADDDQASPVDADSVNSKEGSPRVRMPMSLTNTSTKIPEATQAASPNNLPTQ